MDISCDGAKMYLVIFVLLICVIDRIKVPPDVVDVGVFCCLLVCIYMFGWLCRATYCYVVSTLMLGVSHAIQNKKKLNSRSLHRVIAYNICHIYELL